MSDTPPEGKRRLRQWTFRAAQLVVVGLACAFMARTLAKHWHDVEQLAFEPSWGSLGGATLLALLYLGARGLLWHRIVRRTVGAYAPSLDVACWLASQLGKYLPGKVFLVLGRVYVYRRRGASTTLVGVGFILEMAALFIAAPLLFAAGTLSTEMSAPRGLQLAAATMAVGAVVAAHPRALGALLKLKSRLLKQSALEHPPLRARDTLSDVLHMLGSWLLLGTGLWLLSLSLAPLPLSTMPALTGAFALAGVSGIAVLAAPSGIGVREGVLTVLLSPMIGPGAAAAL